MPLPRAFRQGEDWADDLKEEKILSEISWDILVFNYHRNLQENALSKNYALKILQVRDSLRHLTWC